MKVDIVISFLRDLLVDEYEARFRQRNGVAPAAE